MDISFKNGNEKFNYRVCAIIVNDEKILAMKDDNNMENYHLSWQEYFHRLQLSRKRGN